MNKRLLYVSDMNNKKRSKYSVRTRLGNAVLKHARFIHEFTELRQQNPLFMNCLRNVRTAFTEDCGRAMNEP